VASGQTCRAVAGTFIEVAPRSGTVFGGG
jgi:hypothetical protein